MSIIDFRKRTISPGPPPLNFGRIYVNADGSLRFIFDNGTEYTLGGSQADITNPLYETLGLNKLASQPATPASGVKVWADANGTIHRLNDDGTDSLIGSGGGGGSNSVADGRLTLLSGDPVPSQDLSGAATLYYTSYIGNQLSLCTLNSGVRVWSSYSFTELSLSLASILKNTNYDVYAYVSNDQPALGLQAWTDNTTRSVGIVRYDGVMCLSDPTKRLLGTLRGVANGQCADSETQRFLANLYNPVLRPAFKEVINNHSYTGGLRIFANNANAKIDFVLCEPMWVPTILTGTFGNGSSSESNSCYLVYGLDRIGDDGGVTNQATANLTLTASKAVSFAAGYHYVTICEFNVSGGDYNWADIEARLSI